MFTLRAAGLPGAWGGGIRSTRWLYCVSSWGKGAWCFWAGPKGCGSWRRFSNGSLGWSQRSPRSRGHSGLCGSAGGSRSLQYPGLCGSFFIPASQGFSEQRQVRCRPPALQPVGGDMNVSGSFFTHTVGLVTPPLYASIFLSVKCK